MERCKRDIVAPFLYYLAKAFGYDGIELGSDVEVPIRVQLRGAIRIRYIPTSFPSAIWSILGYG
jgi:hypothetical protein